MPYNRTIPDSRNTMLMPPTGVIHVPTKVHSTSTFYIFLLITLSTWWVPVTLSINLLNTYLHHLDHFNFAYYLSLSTIPVFLVQAVKMLFPSTLHKVSYYLLTCIWKVRSHTLKTSSHVININIPSVEKQQQKWPFQGLEELYGEPIHKTIHVHNKEQSTKT